MRCFTVFFHCSLFAYVSPGLSHLFWWSRCQLCSSVQGRGSCDSPLVILSVSSTEVFLVFFSMLQADNAPADKMIIDVDDAFAVTVEICELSFRRIYIVEDKH